MVTDSFRESCILLAAILILQMFLFWLAASWIHLVFSFLLNQQLLFPTVLFFLLSRNYLVSPSFLFLVGIEIIQLLQVFSFLLNQKLLNFSIFSLSCWTLTLQFLSLYSIFVDQLLFFLQSKPEGGSGRLGRWNWLRTRKL